MSSNDDLFGDDSSDDDMPLENEPVVHVQFYQMNEGNFLVPLHDIEADFHTILNIVSLHLMAPRSITMSQLKMTHRFLPFLMNGMPHKFLRVNHYRRYQMQIIFKNIL
jgi:hypothetical protein